jgi:cytochrome c peroxidase
MRNKKEFIILVILVAVIVAGISLLQKAKQPPRQVAPPAKPIGAVVEIKAPLGLPAVPIPADNPPTAETISLGKRLYYDTALSVDRTVSCASCHDPQRGFADPRQFSVGVNQKLGGRNSPPVANAAYFEVQFWDGRAPTLEAQAEGPVQNPVEMAHTLKGVEEKLSRDPTYVDAFHQAFGEGPITYEKVGKAIASFERTVLLANSPFDRWYFGHDKKAISTSAERGFEVFRRADKANCAVCHTVAESHALFTDNKFHNIGVGVKDGVPKDAGRFDVTKNEADRGAFKTPSLRNIALTAPYMHDGSLKDLKQVIDFYIGGGNSNEHLDKNIKALDFLTGQERADLLVFLQSLTGEVPKETLPEPKTPGTSSGK